MDRESGERAAAARRILGRCVAVFDRPPQAVPHWHAADGPLMGNGDLAVCLGKGPEPGLHQFWLSKNDFWRLSSRYIRGEKRCSPKTFGTFNVTVPALAAGPYRVLQQLLDAQTILTLAGDRAQFTLRAWVAATSNLLVLELSVLGQPVEVRTDLWVKPEHSTTAGGCEGGVVWATRRFDADDVAIPVGAAAAARRLDRPELSFTLWPGEPVTLALAMQSSFKSARYREEAVEAAAGLTPESLEKLRCAHRAWWLAYWSRSLVEFADPELMFRYYLSHYVLGCASRDPEFPPPLFGSWATTDDRAWSGDYHLNYNHQAPFYALYKSNRIEQADPFHAPLLDYMSRAAEHAQKAQSCRGLYYPVGIGPKGADTTGWMPEWAGTEAQFPSRRRENRENGVEFFNQRSNGAYCAANIAMRWYHTYDPEYAARLYPFVRGVAAFWEDYLQFEGGRYVIRNDSIEELSGPDFNPLLSLGLVPMLFALALEMSAALGVDPERHERWRHILAHMSPFPTQNIDGKTVFRYSEQGMAWSTGNTLGIQHIYPAGAIGPDSPPELLEVARNTVAVLNRWNEGGGTTSYYPAAVRVGCDPELVLDKLKGLIAAYHRPNGLQGALEDCSTVPNTINEMLCMSHRQILRLFPAWPRDRDAQFWNLRAEGAFLVSSALQGGRVQYVRIESERGRPCWLVNPWPGEPLVICRDGRKPETLSAERVMLLTQPGETLGLQGRSEPT